MFGGKGGKGGGTTTSGLGIITHGRLFQGFLLEGFNRLRARCAKKASL